MKLLLGILLVACCLAAPVRAQDAGSPEAFKAAEELAAVLTGGTVNQMTRAMADQMWPGIESQVGKKVNAAALAEIRTEFERALVTFTDEIMKDAPLIYARHFTAQELRDMVAFYKSPAGVKSLHVMPQVMADISTQAAPRMQAFQSDLAAKIKAVMQKHGHKD